MRIRKTSLLLGALALLWAPPAAAQIAVGTLLQRSPGCVEIIESAARTGTTNSNDFLISFNQFTLILDVNAIAATPAVNMQPRFISATIGTDAIDSCFAGNITAVGVYFCPVGFLSAGADGNVDFPMPFGGDALMDVNVNHGDADSITYAVYLCPL